MARTNYQHGKRLRELAKKQKREEKAARRKEKKETGGPEELILAPNTLLEELGTHLAGETEESDDADDSATPPEAEGNGKTEATG